MPVNGPLAPRRRFPVLLGLAALLVVAAPRVSDVRTQRIYEIKHILPFEHPVGTRWLFLAMRAITGSPTGMAIVTVVVGVAAAVAVAWLLRAHGADSLVWTAAPTLVLVGQNVDAVTCVFIVLAIAMWRRDRFELSGLAIGLGAAFKLTPAVLLPALAVALPWRRSVRLVAIAVAAWATCNAPYALTHYERWRFPYRFASLRDDVKGSVWAALPFGRDTVNRLSLAVLVLVVVAVCVLVLRRRVDALTGCVLLIAAFLAVNKVWQPHYILWLLAVHAFVAPPTRALRWLEASNLAYFLVFWSRADPTTTAPFIWLTAGARVACLAWVVVEVVRRQAAVAPAATAA